MTSAPAHPSTLRLHGTAEVRRAGAAPQTLERKQAALLAWLSVEGPTPRARIAALLWPEVDDERARANLRQRLAKLRALDADLLVDDGRLLALSADVKVEPEDVVQGTLLSAFDYADCEVFAQWLDGQREAARTLRQQAWRDRARSAVETGDFAAAQQAAEALLVLDHESEDAHRLLMQALYLRGAYAEAITVWDRCREMLRQLYGVPPSPATQVLGEMVLQAARDGRMAAVGPRDAMPLSLLRPPRLVGRSRALDSLLAGWYAGHHVWVGGAAGLGKSRLLDEMLSAAGGGVSVAARPGDALQPFAALGRLVLAALDRCEPAPEATLLQTAARLLPALARRVASIAAPPNAVEREQALQAIAQVLAHCIAQGGGPVLVFDDLQYADLASVEAMTDLLLGARATPATSLRLALGCRSGEETPQASALNAALVQQGRLVRVELEPLGQPEVASLLQSLALPGIDAQALAPVLRRRVGGNPAFLLESLKLLLAMGPDAMAQPDLLPLAPGIDAVVRRRIGLLSAAARQLAQLAAVAGSSFSPALAADVLGQPVAELAPAMRELEQRQVLYGRRFVHDLVARSVLGTIAEDSAAALHRRLAEALLRHGAPAAVLAGHWRACGEWQRAGQCLVAAADSARQALRPVEQSQWLDAAAECLDRAGDSDALFDVIETRLAVSDALDRTQRRVPLMDRLDALARTPQQQLRALSQRVGWHTDNARQDAFELGRQGLERALALDLPDLAFGFLNGVAWQLAMSGQAQAALAAIERHRDWVLTQPPAVQAEFHLVLSGVHGFSDHLGPAIASAEDATALLRAAGRTERTLPTLANIGLLRWWRGELDAAKVALLEAQLLRDRMQGGGASLIIDLNLGAVLRDRGEFLAAHDVLVAVLDKLRQAARDAGASADLTDVVMAENHLAAFWLLVGQPLAARASLQASDDCSIDVRFRARRAGLRLRIARRLGEPDPPDLDDTVAMVECIGSPFNRAWVEMDLACTGSPEVRLAAFARLADCPPVLERPGLHLHAALRAAQAARACGQQALALQWLDQALALAEHHDPFDIDRAELWLTAGELFDADGRSTEATQWRRHGVNWLHRTAQHHLQAPWRHAFLTEHPVNRALLAAAAAD
jgi:DNA-binding SARP family transcriptional activator